MMSIHQLSRRLKLPYGTAYNRIHILHEQGIVQMLAQGKAKLCALNPENPMTACLLALGSAQLTEHFIRENPDSGKLLKTIKTNLEANFAGSLVTAILLTPGQLKSIGNHIPGNAGQAEDAETGRELTLDFFYICNDSGFDEAAAENITAGLLPPGLPVKVTSMSLDCSTLLGMFTENENEAGLSAYGMLHEGLIMFGFESFYRLILEAFSRKLGR
ncbi:MAG: hypothetical protein KKB51_09745 [Candidatus Riflebacteria bacterium]|nr:hypothetical protein [Candidatus Riflebacteria bacterium]